MKCFVKAPEVCVHRENNPMNVLLPLGATVVSQRVRLDPVQARARTSGVGSRHVGLLTVVPSV